MSRIECAMTSKLKALGGCSSHHLRGAGAYCGDRTTGHIACWSLPLILSVGAAFELPEGLWGVEPPQFLALPRNCCLRVTPWGQFQLPRTRRHSPYIPCAFSWRLKMIKSAGSVPKTINDLLSEKHWISQFFRYRPTTRKWALNFSTPQLFFDNLNSVCVWGCTGGCCVRMWADLPVRRRLWQSRHNTTDRSWSVTLHYISTRVSLYAHFLMDRNNSRVYASTAKGRHS